MVLHILLDINGGHAKRMDSNYLILWTWSPTAYNSECTQFNCTTACRQSGEELAWINHVLVWRPRQSPRDHSRMEVRVKGFSRKAMTVSMALLVGVRQLIGTMSPVTTGCTANSTRPRIYRPCGGRADYYKTKPSRSSERCL